MKMQGSTGRWQSAPVPAAAPEAADEVVGGVSVVDGVATLHRRRRQLLQRIGEAALKSLQPGWARGLGRRSNGRFGSCSPASLFQQE
jgi:hypothetical protein